MDIIFTGGGCFIILWWLFSNILQNHNRQDSKGNKSSNDPLPMPEPKLNKRVNNAFKQ